MVDLDELFSPFRTGHKDLKNRVALAPIYTGAEDDKGGVTD
jgi:2,4-dienoyl-CoA reductase-like NADH-dependent reductase (Old Yellow Enzyme family)